jgi:hypothetical protein
LSLVSSFLIHKHSKISLERLDEFESNLREERLKVNYKLGEESLSTKMLSIEKNIRRRFF